MIIVMGDGGVEFAGVCSWIDKMTKWSEVKVSVVSDPLWTHGLYSPWNSSGLNTGAGSLSLLQGIFSPRDWTQVSCIAGGYFTSWATRESPMLVYTHTHTHTHTYLTGKYILCSINSKKYTYCVYIYIQCCIELGGYRQFFYFSFI